MTNNEIIAAQMQMIVKSNDLIEKSQYELSLEEHKVLLYMISKIKPQDDVLQEYTFSIDDYCAVCNKDNSGGTYYNYLRDTMLRLKKRVIHIETEEEEIIADWFAQAILDRKTRKTFRVMFAPAMRPYLFGLKNYTTRYPVEYILPMTCKYSTRMYEYMRCIKYKGYKRKCTLEELRKRTGCADKFILYKDLRKNVIEPALIEINKYTDLKVQYRVIKTGRKVTEIEFLILTPGCDENSVRDLERGKALGQLVPNDAEWIYPDELYTKLKIE